MEFVVSLWLAITGYIIGSIPSAVLLSKLLGYKDPRTQGSGNIGFSNVMRTSESKLFPLLVLFSDVSKGILTAVVGSFFQGAAVCSAFCLLGNLYALYPSGSGKGVSVVTGVLLYLNWMNVLLMVIWFILSKLYYPVIGSMILVGYFAFITYSTDFWIFLPLLALIVWKHRDNIIRLFNGTENKI